MMHFLRFFVAFPTSSVGVWLASEQILGQATALISNESLVEFAKIDRYRKVALRTESPEQPPPPNHSTGSEWENLRLRWRAKSVQETIPVPGSTLKSPEEYQSGLLKEILWDMLPGVQLKKIILKGKSSKGKRCDDDHQH